MTNINSYIRLARLDKPAGAWLLLLPCWMGLALAGYHALKFYALFTIGAVTMRAAGCIINDIADRKYDAQIKRTKTRPLASGEIKLPQALIFLTALLAIGLIILLQLPRIAITIGLFSIPLFITYPFMKRITYWPQFFLGLTFNIGILIAYVTIAKTLSTAAVNLYIGAIFWTLGYDTIYAHQDRDDDAKIGVKSTALRLGKQTKLAVSIFYAIFLMLIFYAANPNPIIFTLATLHFAWQIYSLDINNRENCMRIFKSNIYAGLLIVTAILT